MQCNVDTAIAKAASALEFTLKPEQKSFKEVCGWESHIYLQNRRGLLKKFVTGKHIYLQNRRGVLKQFVAGKHIYLQNRRGVLKKLVAGKHLSPEQKRSFKEVCGW